MAKSCSFLLALALLAACARAQYPGQLQKDAKSPQTPRAVAVLEWTGDEGRPKASRLVPVVVFDQGELQDAGVYLARPEPFSLAGGVEYELQTSGKVSGLYDVKSAGQEQGGWMGYGNWRNPPKPKPAKPQKIEFADESWDDASDRPVLHRKKHADDPAGDKDAKSGGDKNADPDRPTLHKKSDSTDAQAADPDRPVLHKKADETQTADKDSDGDADRPVLHKKSDDAADKTPAATDPDRPVLRKPEKADGKKKKKPADEGSVEALASATDPDRPRLKRGKPEDGLAAVLPSLMGMPADLQQRVAVSDSTDRGQHLWSYTWGTPEDEQKMKSALEDKARAALGLLPPPAAPEALPALARKSTKKSGAKTVPVAEPPEPAPLLDEDFHAFELVYGGGATLVLSAHTDSQGRAPVKFATLVAQPDLYGNLQVLLTSVTDAAHLDGQPRLRLVDAVDALGDNRAELLFELRGRTLRQFALYRVQRGQAEQIFATAPADIVPPRDRTGE